MGKGKYQNTGNTKNGGKKGKLLLKNEEMFRGKAHTNLPGATFKKLSGGAIFTVCSHTFILF